MMDGPLDLSSLFFGGTMRRIAGIHRFAFALLIFLALVGLALGGCSSTSSGGSSKSSKDKSGDGGGNSNPVPILRAFPYDGMGDASPRTPVMIIFDRLMNVDTITSDSFNVTQDGDTVNGNLLFEQDQGYTIVVFVSDGTMAEDTKTSVTLGTDIVDEDGNTFDEETAVGFTTGTDLADSDSTNINFDGGMPASAIVEGDGAVLDGFGDVDPAGTGEVYLSTGNALLSSDDALDSATSVVALYGATHYFQVNFWSAFVSEQWGAGAADPQGALLLFVARGHVGAILQILHSVDLSEGEAVDGIFSGLDEARYVGPADNIVDTTGIIDCDNCGGETVDLFFILSNERDGTLRSVGMVDNVNNSD
jgi:hypothetical protein